MAGRPPKSLLAHVQDASFRARRHWRLLAGPELPWPGFALLQRRYQAAASEAEQRRLAVEFEQALALVHAQAANEDGDGEARLAGELALLGKPGSVKQLLAFFPAYLVHPKGPTRGQPFALEPWQQRFLREFYRRDRAGRRVYRTGILGVPRGNGKTPLAAGLALYELVSRSDAPEVFFAAGSKEQAGIAYGFAESLSEAGPLSEWLRFGRHSCRCQASAGQLRVLSSEGRLQFGLAPAVAILDELWAFTAVRARELYDAMATGLHKREDAYLQTIDPTTEVPPADVFAVRYRRPIPYLWSTQDICRLLEQARALRPPLRAATFETLFGLLAVSGIRVGEAVALQVGDLDLDEGLITIRAQVAKLERARLVPLHPTTVAALDRYAAQRERVCPQPRSRAFFLSASGTAIDRGEASKTLRKITTAIGVRTATVHPRAHDLRHSFAVRTLVAWQRAGVQIDERISALSTYLGHAGPAETYWYLTATPELMGLAADRLNQRFGARS